MDEIRDVEELRSVLKPLAARRLVVYLTPPDRRGTMLTHGLHAPEELEAARTRFAEGAVSEYEPPGVNPVLGSGMESRLADAFAEIEKLKRAVSELREQLAAVRKGLGLAAPSE
jgi:hypothetical protein